MRLAVVAIGLALLPAPASAATATVAYSSGSGELVQYEAAPGEINAVTVQISSDALQVTLTDTGATIDPEDGCVSITPSAVSCTAPGGDQIARVRAVLQDGNDRFAAPPTVPTGFTGVDASGGDGDDDLVGGPGQDTLDGGAGKDLLRGAAGNDFLEDGEREAEAQADIYDGGSGSDFVDYLGRKHGVRVDLRKPRFAGAPGEHDALTSIENIGGGHGDDRLIGNARGNIILGSSGSDVLIGLGGPDALSGNSGDDRLRGGRGDDRLFGGWGDDILIGGAGHDRLRSGHPRR